MAEPGRPWTQRVLHLSRWGLGLGLGAAGLTWGFHWATQNYVEHQVLPQVQSMLEGSLDRPVQLGAVTFVYPWQINLGQSSVEDLLTVEGVHVGVNLWHWLWTQEAAVQITLLQPTLTLRETDQGWLSLPLQTPAQTGSLPLAQVTVRVEDGSVLAYPQTNPSAPPLHLTNLQGTMTASTGENLALRFQTAAQLAGQRLQLQGHGDGSTWQIQGRGWGIPVAPLTSVLPQLPQDANGQVDIDVDVTVAESQLSSLVGWVSLQDVNLTLPNVPQPLRQVNGRLRLQEQRLHSTDLQLNYGALPVTVQGSLDWGTQTLNLQGVTAPTAYAQVADTLGLPTDIPITAQLQAQVNLSGSLDRPQLRGSFQSTGRAQVDQLTIEEMQGQFLLREQEIFLSNLQANLAGGTLRGAGRVPLGGTGSLTWQAERLDVARLSQPYGVTPPTALGLLSGQGTVQMDPRDPQITATWQLQGGELEGSGGLSWQNGLVTVPSATLQVLGGRVDLNARLDAQQTTAQLTVTGIPIPSPTVGAESPGQFSGIFQVRGPSPDLRLATTRIQGELQASLSALSVPIQAQGTWDGQRLLLSQGTLANLGTFSGQIPIDPATLQLGPLDLRLTTQDLPLTAIPLWPTAIPSSGTITGQAHLQGSPNDLSLQGTLALHNLTLAEVPFAPQLKGTILWQQRSGQTSVDLRGGGDSASAPQGDRLALRLGSQGRPEQFVVQQGSTRAEGRGTADTLAVTFRQVPVTWLQGVVPSLPPLTGQLEGDVQWDWQSQSAQGQATIAALTLNGIRAQSLRSQFRYQPRQLDLTELSLTLFESEYQLTGQVLLPPNQDPQLNLRLLTQTGNLQDIVSAFRWRSWEDLLQRGLNLPQLGPASDLEVNPISVLGLALAKQLERYEEILAELATLASQQAQAQLRIPPLRSLRGTFQAQATLTGSLADPRLTFNLNGEDWDLADRQTTFALDTVTVSGTLAENTLTLAPLQLTHDNRTAIFRGQLGQGQQQGSLSIDRMPMTILQPFLPRLLRVQGDLSLMADISGNMDHPQISGQLTIAQARLNQVPLEAASGRFSYQNGQLNLNSALQLNPQAPVSIIGQIPLRLPFSQDTPNPQALNLNLKLENDGLELVNLLTTAIRWEGEQENLDLTIRGSLSDPVLLGNLTVKGGTLRVPQLPAPITDLEGQVRFNLNQIEVDTLSGRFSQGTVNAQGILSVNQEGRASETVRENPLTLALRDIQMDVPIYQGRTEGDLTVHGHLFNPLLGGQITLSQGTIDVGNLNPVQQPSAATPPNPTAPQIEFNGLAVVLTGPTDIRHPLFRFIGGGRIQLFGSVQQPIPEGVINLDRGQVNLFATTFRLDRSRSNTVTFDRNPDPVLDLRLATQATEFFRDTSGGLVFDASRNLPGSQQTIQIRADVNGRASALAQNDPRTSIVQLSSSPFRTRDEIIGLLGGDAIASLSANNGVLGLAGSALFFSLQDTLIETLSLDDVRLGPVVQTQGENSANRFSVGLGLEVAKDLGPNLSVSLQQNLTDPQATLRYGLRYRLNDSMITRISTDLKGDSSIALEFETRF
ncbi:MAG: translocation/assembly module TamB domain-containing protein [Synechococcales cyanobacterium]